MKLHFTSFLQNVQVRCGFFSLYSPLLWDLYFLIDKIKAVEKIGILSKSSNQFKKRTQPHTTSKSSNEKNQELDRKGELSNGKHATILRNKAHTK